MPGLYIVMQQLMLRFCPDTGMLAGAQSQPGAPDPEDYKIAESPNS